MKKALFILILTSILIIPSAFSQSDAESVIGQTTYDLQTNASMQERIVLHGDGTISAVWTYSESYDVGAADRGTGYNYFDGMSWGTIPSSRIDITRTGWPTLMANSDIGERVYAHSPIYGTWRSPIGTGGWNSDTITGSNLILWPKAAASHDTLHVIGVFDSATEIDGVVGALFYNRSLDNGLTWDITDLQIAGLDSSEYVKNQGDMYDIDVNGARVAIVNFSWGGNVNIALSTDGGNTFNTRTVYDFPTAKQFDPTTTMLDIDQDLNQDTALSCTGQGNVIIDGLGTTHVFYTATQMTSAGAGGSFFPGLTELYYWNTGMADDSPVKISSPIDYNNDGLFGTGYGIPSYGNSGCIGFPTAGLDASNNLYCTFMANHELQNNGISNFNHIYAIKSIDGGNTWTSPYDITSDQTDMECAYPAMAKIANDTIHVVYQRDTEPGIAVSAGFHSFVLNEIVYAKVNSCLFNVRAISTAESSAGASDGSVEVFRDGGVSPYSYNWSNGSSSPNLTGLSSGTYSVTVTDNIGCVAIDVAQPLPTPSALNIFSAELDTLWENSYYQIPLVQSLNNPMHLNAKITNVSGSNADNTVFNISVTDGVMTFWNDQTIGDTIFPSDTNFYFAPTPFTASNLGVYTTYFWATSDIDYTDTIVGSFEVTDSIYARDNGSSSGDWAINTDNYQTIGNAFQIYSTQEASSISFELNSGAQVGSTIEVMILESDLGSQVESEFYIIQSGDPGNWITVPFASSATLSGGNTYIAAVRCYDSSSNNVAIKTAQAAVPQSSFVEDFTNTWFYINNVPKIRLNMVGACSGFSATTWVTNESSFGMDDGSASVSVSGGTSPYTYNWSNGGTTSSITGISSNTYNVTIEDNSGCTIIETAVVTTVSSVGNVPADWTAPKRVVAEFLAATAVGWSPRAYVMADSVVNTYPDDASVIIARVQDWGTDPMANSDYETNVSWSQVPVSSVNRTNYSGQMDIDPLNVIDSISNHLGIGAPMNVSVTYNWDNGTRELTVNVIGDFVATLTGVNYRFNAVVCENNVTSTDPSYNQANSYSGGGVGPMGGFESLPNPVPASQMVYNHVARDIMGGFGGVPGTLPNNINPGEQYDNDFYYTIPAGYNENNIYIVGWISDIATGQILNSAEVHFTGGSTSCSNPPTLPVSGGIITNDVNTCSNGNNGSIELFPSGGVSPYSYDWSTGANTSTISGLTAGLYEVTVTGANACSITESISVSAPSILTAIATVTNADCGQPTGEISLAISGGTPPYSIGWNNGETDFTIDTLNAGTYVANITDDNGCLLSKTYNVIDANGPNIATVAINNPSCNGDNDGSIDITVSGGTLPYSIQWSTGAITQDISNLPDGIYDLEVEDDNGCIAITSYTISEPSEVGFNLNITDASCGGADGSASVSPIGGTTPYSIIWSTGSTAPSITGLSAQVYSVGVIDANSCSYNSPVAINEIGAPTIVIDSVNHINCGLTNGAIYASAAGGTTPYSFNWYDASNGNSVSSLDIGTYGLTVTGNNGCKASSAVEIGNAIEFSDPICLVTVDSVTQTNLLAWEKAGVGYISHYNIYREGSQAGAYNKIAEVPYDSLGVFTDSIANPSVRSWRYKISFTDTCGEESEKSAVHKTIHLTQNLGINETVNLLWDHYEGFTFDTYYIYRFTDTQGWEEIDSLPNNLTSFTDQFPPIANDLWYAIEVRHPDGCNPTSFKAANYSSSRSNRPNGIPSPATGANLPPSSDFIANATSIPVGGSVDFLDQTTNNPTTWLWLFSGGTPGFASSQNPSGITYNNAGTYEVTLITTNANGSDTITKVDYISVGGTGIEDIRNNPIVSIYPNPNNGLFTLDIDNASSSNVVVTIYNSLGQQVEIERFSINSKSVREFDIAGHGAGIYNVEININGQSTSKRLVVK